MKDGNRPGPASDLSGADTLKLVGHMGAPAYFEIDRTPGTRTDRIGRPTRPRPPFAGGAPGDLVDSPKSPSAGLGVRKLRGQINALMQRDQKVPGDPRVVGDDRKFPAPFPRVRGTRLALGAFARILPVRLCSTRCRSG